MQVHIGRIFISDQETLFEKEEEIMQTRTKLFSNDILYAN